MSLKKNLDFFCTKLQHCFTITLNNLVVLPSTMQREDPHAWCQRTLFKMRSTIYQRAAGTNKQALPHTATQLFTHFQLTLWIMMRKMVPHLLHALEDIPILYWWFLDAVRMFSARRRMHVFCSVSFSVWPAPVLYRLCKEKEGPPTHLLNLATVQHHKRQYLFFFALSCDIVFANNMLFWLSSM